MRKILISIDSVHELTRRLFLGANLAVASIFLAGCNGDAGGVQNGGGTSSTTAESQSAAPAAPFSGTFEGMLAGSPVKLVLEQHGDQLTGRISSGLQSSTVTATATGNSAKGRFQDPDGTGGDAEFVRQGDALNMKLIVADAATGNSLTFDVAFKPVGSGASSTAQTGNSNAAGERDSMLVGRWIYTEAGGSGGFSYAVDTHFALNDDGTYRYGDSKAAAGDASNSTISEGGDAEVGQWRTEGKILYLKSGDQTEWSPLGRYYVEPSRFMITYNNGNKRVWERE